MLTADVDGAREYAQLRQRIEYADEPERADLLAELARGVRRDVLVMIEQARLGHIGGDFSVADILVTLYGAVLNVDPERPQWHARDRFILSKGHCAGALYATLAACGFFSRA